MELRLLPILLLLSSGSCVDWGYSESGRYVDCWTLDAAPLVEFYTIWCDCWALRWLGGCGISWGEQDKNDDGAETEAVHGAVTEAARGGNLS